MGDSLKKCPFCGGKARYVYSMPLNYVECTKCKALGAIIVDAYEQRDGKKEAVDAWNRRADDGWINVEDRLPEAGKRVLILMDSGTVFCGEIKLRELLPEWWYYYDPQSEDMDMLSVVCWSGRLNPVTHWMPLPEPPKEDE